MNAKQPGVRITRRLFPEVLQRLEADDLIVGHLRGQLLTPIKL